MKRKSTNKELVEELEKINIDGRFDQFIENAKANRYHDYKNPEDVVCGKTLFAMESYGIPELEPLRNAIINGEYDETADEEDKAAMRRDMPAHMWDSFGLTPSN